jgi:hypothetical protein
MKVTNDWSEVKQVDERLEKAVFDQYQNNSRLCSPTFLPFLSAPRPVRILLFLDDNKAPSLLYLPCASNPSVSKARRSLKQAKALHDGFLALCFASRHQQQQ